MRNITNAHSYVKDIKTAILATDLIVHKWGFKDYKLHIYGDMERAPAYASECQEVIASKGLREHVMLKGLGNPSVVLQDAVSNDKPIANSILTQYSGSS